MEVKINKDIREFSESIFFGSMPVTYLFTTLGGSIINSFGIGSELSFGKSVLIASGFSLIIAITDYLLGLK
ncbi:MAG: hypothetical protein HUK24_01430 [Sphaerochaetaceae bacterium]|nr:hypothetical protein [Sphaerochaetaceae bacterium]